MKHLTEALRRKVSSIYQLTVEKIATQHKNNQLEARQRPIKTRPFKKASLFLDGKTNIAALSIVLRGVAEVLSQKMDLPWKTEESGTLSYEKQVSGGKGKICYYVTDNPEIPHPEILAKEAALAAIEQFDPRACAIHLIYCALVAKLEQPWKDNFVIDEKQLLEYTGLNKRRDLSKHEQLLILYNLSRQPAQILASIAQSKQGKVGAFTIADIQIWDIAIVRDVDADEKGNSKLIGLKVIGKPGAWTKYFLNKSEYYRHTGIITKKTVQKLFSIGKQNAGAARLLIWLTFQIQPGFEDYLSGKTLMEIAYGEDRVALAQQDRQLRRQLADDFETDLKVVKEAQWQIELENEPAWLKDSYHTKRPIGYWDELLNTRWRFNLPTDVQECLMPPSQHRVSNIQKKIYIQPPAGNIIREARKAKGWSRADFAKLMGKSVSWVDAVETGHRMVSQKDLAKLLKALQLNIGA
jgi:DNA-binding transcriptional regulator YiaG